MTRSKGALPPRATQRLQFHAGFTLDDGAALVPYLARLGISHIYASPLFAARRGSLHGYDVIDYGAVNPDLGGRPALERLSEALRRHGMGLLLDIVPNHMAADTANPWWRDVLARGRASRYAGFFDIDWASPDPHLRGKLLLPVLGRPYAEALAAGEVRIDRAAGEVVYFEHRFPLAAGTERGGDPHAVLEAQHWRLAWWRTAADRINWRRFFDINGLVALRAERSDVFAASHALVLELFGAGLIDGVRVDHIDGLADPGAYCRRLKRALVRAGNNNGGGRAPYLVVEKILAPGETLPPGWPVDGTTGYDFMADAAALLHDAAGAVPLARLWSRLSGETGDFAAVEHAARTELLATLFGADAARVARALAAAEPDGDAPPAALGRMMAAVAACFPVYRTYPDGDGTPLRRALNAAADRLPRSQRPWLRHLEAILTAPPAGQAGRAQTRFQLLTAPLAAKAVEDTSFYRYGRLLSGNEVGSSPARFALAPAAFHAAMADRQHRYPHAMLTTATHDHKRGEDVRARLAVLSEIPAEWAALVEGWMRRNAVRRHRLADGAAPGPAEELMLYQTLVAAWPALLVPEDEAGVADFAERVAGWQQKALREAKRRTGWAEPDAAYEDACRSFLKAMLADPALRREVAAFARRIGPAGAINGLAQTMLRLAVPGVPDLYQGTEFWDESLVDPDNRRPVDFGARQAALDPDVPPAALLACWRDGRAKQALIARMLALRTRLPRLFTGGSYQPLQLSGPHADRALAFLRNGGRYRVLVAVTLRAAPLLGGAEAPLVTPAAWRDTTLHLPASAPWCDVLDPDAPVLEGETVPLAALFARLPVACRLAGGEC